MNDNDIILQFYALFDAVVEEHPADIEHNTILTHLADLMENAFDEWEYNP